MQMRRPEQNAMMEGKTFPTFPAHAQPHIFTYLARGPLQIKIMCERGECNQGEQI